MVRIVTVRVWTDVAIQQPYFARFHNPVCIFEIHTTFSRGLNFGSGEDKTCFEFFENLVIVESLTIRCNFLHGLDDAPAPKTAGAIVFIEDTEEAPYRVDRMLTQLIQAGFFREVAGVMLGDFHKSDAPEGTEATDIAWVLHDRLGSLRVPVAYGLPFGHRGRTWTLPVGARARLMASDPAQAPELTLLEAATRARA